jgi:hypothetical protein
MNTLAALGPTKNSNSAEKFGLRKLDLTSKCSKEIHSSLNFQIQETDQHLSLHHSRQQYLKKDLTGLVV